MGKKWKLKISLDRPFMQTVQSVQNLNFRNYFANISRIEIDFWNMLFKFWNVIYIKSTNLVDILAAVCSKTGISYVLNSSKDKMFKRKAFQSDWRQT